MKIFFDVSQCMMNSDGKRLPKNNVLDMQSLNSISSIQNRTVASIPGDNNNNNNNNAAERSSTTSSSSDPSFLRQRGQQQLVQLSSLSPTTNATNNSHLTTSNALFPMKLYTLLEDAEKYGNESIISWNPSGKSFKVHNIDLLTENILPYYFKQTKYRSFQRQLNFWGFSRVSNKRIERGEYFHPQFLKGQKALCSKLSRNTDDNPIKRLKAATAKQWDGFEATESMEGKVDIGESIQSVAKRQVMAQKEEEEDDHDSTISSSGSTNSSTAKKCKSDTNTMIPTTRTRQQDSSSKKSPPPMASSSFVVNKGKKGSCIIEPCSTRNSSLDHGIFGLDDDTLLLDALLREHSKDLISLPACKLCDVFSSDEEQSSSSLPPSRRGLEQGDTRRSLLFNQRNEDNSGSAAAASASASAPQEHDLDHLLTTSLQEELSQYGTDRIFSFDDDDI